ncbi:GAP family protein [Kineococcus terrestris]|uniref:GAP family protein n=1 Tax=Kineococcus terrestris TaxID=2044856 RepID=UPI0034DAC9FA
MLSGPLLLTIAGLAALDSLNAATFAGVVLVLVAAPRRPGPTALAYVAGAYAVVLAVGTALFATAGAVGGAVETGGLWVRRGALVLAATALAVTGLRRLRERRRAGLSLPSWFGPWSAVPAGVLVTAADLPNAFPYLLAVERLTAAQVPTGTGIAVLAAYSLVYCLPCLLLLAVRLVQRERTAAWSRLLHQRFGTARTVPRSVPAATAWGVAAVAVLVVALTL